MTETRNDGSRLPLEALSSVLSRRLSSPLFESALKRTGLRVPQLFGNYRNALCSARQQRTGEIASQLLANAVVAGTQFGQAPDQCLPCNTQLACGLLLRQAGNRLRGGQKATYP